MVLQYTVRPIPPRPLAEARSNTCNGNLLNIRWTPLAGTETISHVVHVAEEDRYVT